MSRSPVASSNSPRQRVARDAPSTSRCRGRCSIASRASGARAASFTATKRSASPPAFIQSSMQDGTKPEEIGVFVRSAKGWPGFR